MPGIGCIIYEGNYAERGMSLGRHIHTHGCSEEVANRKENKFIGEPHRDTYVCVRSFKMRFIWLE